MLTGPVSKSIGKAKYIFETPEFVPPIELEKLKEKVETAMNDKDNQVVVLTGGIRLAAVIFDAADERRIEFARRGGR